MPQSFDHSTKAGTLGGTLLTIFANIKSEDLIKTAILAGMGAMVSFIVTLLFKLFIRWVRK